MLETDAWRYLRLGGWRQKISGRSRSIEMRCQCCYYVSRHNGSPSINPVIPWVLNIDYRPPQVKRLNIT